MFKLEGRKVLITGASGGLGKAMANAFYSKGCELVLHGTNKQKLENLKDELLGGENSNSSKIHVIVADLANHEEVKELAKQSIMDMNGVDVLINNAGITRDGLLMRMKDEDFLSVLNINLVSCCLLSREISIAMLKQRFGRIINISSVVGFLGNPGQSNYCAAKAGLVGFTKALAREVATKNITVNCIAPGFVESAMTEKLNDKQKDAILATIPVRRMCSADEIAPAAIYLASDEAAYITGQCLHVNGGMAMI